MIDNPSRPAPTVAPPSIDTVAGDSPLDAAVPFWVTACVRLQPPQRRNGSTVDFAADKVLTAAQVLLADRIKAARDADVELDRTKVSRWCGYDSSKKAGWIFDYLVLIGFLVIEQRYVRGRRGRAADTFKVFTQPPIGYVGPRTYAEVDRALDNPDFPRTLFMASPTNRRSASRVQGRNQDQTLRSQVEPKTSKPTGQQLGSHLGPKTDDLGSQVGHQIRRTAGQNLGSHVGTFLQIDRSSISEGEEIEDRFEPVPGGAALPPATGMDEMQLREVREAVRAFPINAWYAKRGQARTMSRQDADVLQAAVCEAMQRASLTLEQVREIGQAAVTDAKKTPVAYVVRAFGAKLPTWLARVSPEPEATNPLPLLDNVQTPVGKPSSIAPSEPTCERGSVVEDEPCRGCGAEPGATRMWRMVETDDGRMAPCQVCCPPPPGR